MFIKHTTMQWQTVFISEMALHPEKVDCFKICQTSHPVEAKTDVFSKYQNDVIVALYIVIASGGQTVSVQIPLPTVSVQGHTSHVRCLVDAPFNHFVMRLYKIFWKV